MSNYKRLTNKNLSEFDPEYDFCKGCEYFGEPNGCNRWNGTCGNYEQFNEMYNRLAELEDKIEKGTLVFIDEPFWSEYHDCWAVFQRTEDIVQTCYMTVTQAKDYKKFRGIKNDKKQEKRNV